MRARPADEQHARLPWLIVTMAVVSLATGAIAAWYAERRLAASGDESLALAVAWILAWLPMFAFALWASARLRKESTRAQHERAHALTAEATYRQLVEQARDIIYRTDAQGRFTFVNSVVTRLMGHAPQELLGRRFVELIRPDVREDAERFYGRQFARQTPSTYYEFPALTRDGVEIWFGQNVQTLIENDRVVGFHAVTRDITERKKVEETLRFTQFAVDHAGDMVFWIDREARFLYVNEAACLRLGYTRDELLKMTVADMDPHYQLDAWPGHWEDLRARKRLRFETEHRAKDGEVYPVEVVANHVQFEGREFNVAFSRDITERKRAEKRLTRSRDLLKSFVEHTPAAVAMLDKDLRYVAISRRWIRDYDLGDQDLIGRHHYDVFPEIREMKEWRDIHQRCLAGAVERREEDRFVREDGNENWLRWEVRPWHDETGDIGGIIMFTEVITERKKAEAAVAASEKRVRTILAAEPECVKVTTEDGILLDMNAAGLAMIEADNLEQVIGQSVCPFVAPAHRDAFAEFTRRVYRGEPGTLQFELTGLKGTRRWMDTHAVPLHDEHNATIGVLAITRDITERKRTEQALRESEAQIRLFMEATADCIWNWDVTGARVTRNSGFERLFGYAAEEIIPTIEWWAERLHPDDREKVWITYGEAVASGRTTCSYEYRFRRRDGSYAVVSDHALMVRDGAGNVVRALGAMTDISARKQAEESLRDSERRFRTIFDQAPLGIAVINSGTGQFRRVNQKYCDIVGYADKDMLACTFQDITHPDDLQADLDNMQRLMEGRIHTFQMEKRYIRKDGAIVWVNLTCVPLWWDHERDNRFHIAMVEDITERRRAEERLAKINECFLGFGVDPGKNINRVTALCGELLGAACALYNHLDGPMLHAVGQWQAPPGFNPVDLAAGHICHDVIQQGGTQPMTVRRLSETSYARTDPNVLPYKLQTYVGMPVKCQNTTVGSLCAVFQRDYVPSEADTKLLGILAAAIGVEEERRLAEEDQKRLLAQLAESRNRFEMFFRETPSAISITTVREGRFLDVNKQAEVLTGYAREELIGRTTVEMNLYVDPAERADIVRKLQETGVLTNLERQIRTKSGEVRTAVFSLVPIMMGADPCLLSIAHDITERKRAEEGLRERSRQQAIEAELSLLAITAQDLPGLLITAVKLVSNALDVDYCEALELLPNGTELRLCASAGWRGDQIGQVKTMRTGSLPHAALHSDQPVIIQDIRSGTRFSGPPWLREHGTVSGMSVTIRGREIPWGLLSVYAAGARNFSHDDINFLQTVSSILATAIERMQAESVLRGANQALRLLSSQLLQVQEDDRRAIARDLHDEIGQSLTAIKLNVERAQRTTDRDTRSRIMRDCVQITERVLGQVRDLSLDLHPSILDDLGLAHALKWYADRQAERAGLKVDVAADASLPRLPQEVEIACFRIAQEALTNVVRHARAGQARITLKRGASAVELCIQDDGIGFVVDAVSSPVNGVASVGLTGMQERAKLLSGTVRIASAPRCGTKVIATLPLHLAGRPTEEAPRS